MPTIAPERVAKLLLKVEQSIHKGGWDQPAVLGWLRLREPERMSFVRFEPPISGDPKMFLGTMIGYAETPEGRAILLGFAQSQEAKEFFGYAFVGEGWMRETHDPDSVDRSRPFADQVGSIETRNLSAVTIQGDVISIMRKRGEKPVTAMDAAWQGGQIPALLLALVKVVARMLPPGRVDLEQLEKVALARPV